VNFAQEYWVIDRKGFYALGALSGLDMMLHLVQLNSMVKRI